MEYKEGKSKQHTFYRRGKMPARIIQAIAQTDSFIDGKITFKELQGKE